MLQNIAVGMPRRRPRTSPRPFQDLFDAPTDSCGFRGDGMASISRRFKLLSVRLARLTVLLENAHENSAQTTKSLAQIDCSLQNAP
jgi:hypothetical protein